MMYEEKKEIRKQISQMLADVGLNQAAIKEMVNTEIKNKVDKAVNQSIDSLNAECSSGNYIKETIQRYLKSDYVNSYACTSAVKEELTNRVIQVVLRGVAKSDKVIVANNSITLPNNATNRMALKALYPDVSEHFFEGYSQEWLDSPYTTEG